MKTHCKYDALIDPAKLKPHPKNRNKHSDEQIERLVGLYRFHGIRHPIIVSKLSQCIVAGHGRREAAIKLGMKTFPVVYQSFENKKAEYAFLQADNAIALWAELDLKQIRLDVPKLGDDFNLDMLGIKNFKITEESKGQCDEDEVPEQVQPQTKRGDIYQLGRHRFMCGDSTSIDDVEKLMSGEKADMVFTDPPYGMSVVKKKGMLHGVGIKGACDSGIYKPIIGDDSTQTAIDAYNLCAGLGIKTLVFWGANFYAEALPPSSGWICWDKENGEDFFADGELAWTNQDKQLRIVRHQWKGMIKASERGEKRVHPTQKPIAVAEWTFERYAKDSTSVLDLFGGSGSTLIACEKTNRKCFMMELDPHYCDVIVARWEKYTGKKAEFISKDKQMRKKKRG